jgi:short-chain fatty acids transporter
MVAIGAVGLGMALALHPRRDPVTLTPEHLERILPQPPPEPGPATTPAQHVERFRGWVWLAALLLAYPLGHSIATRGFGTSWTINAYNIAFLVTALLLHGRPDSFLRACRQGVDAAWGIILQFPFYAGIFGLMQNTGLGRWIGSLFAEHSSQQSYPFVVYVYSAVMNLFVPSAGSKWLIEAPYLIPAGDQLDVSVVTVLLSYAYGDSTTNLIQPFFAIPILAVMRLRFGDVVGYTFLIAVACFVTSSVAMFLIPPHL